jgi:iron complex outermembrane receptor protein
MKYQNILRSTSSRRVLYFTLAGMALATPALAQTSTAPVNLDLGAVLATGTANTAALAKTPGTAPYEAPSLTPLNSTQPTSVVSKNTTDNLLTANESFVDVARLTPSVSAVNPNGPGGQEANGPVIRGFQDGQFNLTYDGIPIGDSNDFTHHSTSFFVNDDIGQTIVDRGPGTAETVGDATFGGTISIRTIDPAAQTTLTPYGSYGSFNTGVEGLRLDTGAIQSADGSSGVFDYEHQGTAGRLQNATQERSNFFGKIFVPVSDNTTVTLLADYNQLYQNPSIGATSDEMAYYGRYFAYTKDPTQQNYSRYNNDHITTDMEYADVRSHLNGGWDYDGKLYTYAYYHEDLNGDDVNDQGTPGQFSTADLLANGAVPNEVVLSPGGAPVAGVPGQIFKNTYRSVGTIQRIQKDFAWGDIKTGAWFDHQVNTRFVQNVSLTNGNAINFDPNDSNGGKVTALNDNGSIERLQHNQLYTFQPYAQVDYEPIDNLTLTGGVKYAFFKRALDAQVQQKTEKPTGYEHDWGKWLPSFEAKYAVSPNLSVYAQAAEGFLAPNLNTFYTNNIQKDAYSPETTWSYQTGTAYQDERLALGADVYLVHFFNFIASSGSGANKIFFNGGGAVYKGVEGEATYTFDSGFSLFGNAGLNNANFTQGHAYITQAPKYTANFGLIYDKNGIYGSIIDQWTGGEYSGNTGAGVTSDPGHGDSPGGWYDPYSIVNVAAGYTLNNAAPHLSQIKVKLNVDNITDQKQIFFDNGTNSQGQLLYFVLPGISTYVTVSVPLSF